MTIYSLDVLLFLFGTSLLFNVWFCYFFTHTQVSQEIGIEGKCSERETYFTRKNQKEKKEQGKMNLIKWHRNAKMDSVLYT